MRIGISALLLLAVAGVTCASAYRRSLLMSTSGFVQLASNNGTRICTGDYDACDARAPTCVAPGACRVCGGNRGNVRLSCASTEYACPGLSKNNNAFDFENNPSIMTCTKAGAPNITVCVVQVLDANNRPTGEIIFKNTVKDANGNDVCGSTDINNKFSAVALKSSTANCVYGNEEKYFTPSNKDLSNLQACFSPCDCTVVAEDDDWGVADNTDACPGALSIPQLKCQEPDVSLPQGTTINNAKLLKCTDDECSTTEEVDSRSSAEVGDSFELGDGCGKYKLQFTASSASGCDYDLEKIFIKTCTISVA